MAEQNTSKSGKSKSLFVGLAVMVVAFLVGGGIYFFGTGNSSDPNTAIAQEQKKSVPVEELMAKGPLPDIIVGNKNAPITIVEYASMTCPHCAHFATEVYPELKKKYIDTGKVRLIFREFPLDILAAKASMLARCAGPKHYMPMVEALFQTQESWAVDGDEAMKRLLGIAREAGMSKTDFDKCEANETLYDNIVKQRARAAKDFGVDSTPTFFINGKNLGPAHEMPQFEAALDPMIKKESAAKAATDSKAAQ